jgi:hypothetical protein
MKAARHVRVIPSALKAVGATQNILRAPNIDTEASRRRLTHAFQPGSP